MYFVSGSLFNDRKTTLVFFFTYYYSMTFQVALETLEGHQRAIMGSMTVEVSAKV
jgi:hypothetical protein